MGTGIDVVAIGGTLNAALSLAIAARLAASYRATSNYAHKHFLLFYFYFGIFYLTFATSQLLLSSATGATVGAFHVVSYFFLYVSIGYLLSFPFYLTGRETLGRRVMLAVLAYNVLFFVARIFTFQPSVRESLAQYSYWRPVFPEALRFLTGLVAVGTAGFVALFFLRHGLRHRDDRLVYRRSLWLGLGIALLMLAAISAFVAAPSGSATFVMFATTLVLVALMVLLHGVRYHSVPPPA